MKPIVIYLDRRDGKVELTRKEFEDYINKAYQQGYDCGYAEGKKSYWTPYITCTNSGSNTPITINPAPHVSPFTYDTQITCDNNKNSIFAPGNKVTATNSIYPGDNAIEKIVTG